MALSEEQWDNLIRQQIREEIESIPAPPVDEQWQKFQQRYGAGNKQQPRPLWGKKWAWAAVLLLAIGSYALLQPQQAVAFGERLVEIFNVVVGKTTMNKMFSQDPSSPASSTPVMDQSDSSNPIEAATLEEAQSKVPFKIITPGYLPTGMVIDKIILTKGMQENYRVSLMYKLNDSYLSFSQEEGLSNGGKSILYDIEDSATKDLDINGASGILLMTKDGIWYIYWSNEGFDFELQGSLSEEEIIRVAESVKQ